MSLDQLLLDRAEYVNNIKELDSLLAQAPDDEDVNTMKAELEGEVKKLDTQIASLKSATTAASTADPVASSASASSEKWSKENHPAYRKQQPATATPVVDKKAPVSFKVNDNVLAKWAADKQFYEARIISVTGSSAAPIYTISYKGWPGTETVRLQDMRPLPSAASAAQKRKADGSPAVSAPSTPVVNTPVPGVISAEANINPALANAVKRDQIKSLDGDSSSKPTKKVKTSKALESSKNNWKAWQSKASSGKAAKVVHKESMFRTGEAPTARVGFTGSGQAMRKDVERTRHNYTLD